jgi:hypothetical protein
VRILEEERYRYSIGVILGICGSVGGYLAIECIVIGLRMTKSALASFAE